MLETILKNVKTVHFIGIGGISMSALAKILHSEGFLVTGSDSSDSHIVRSLEQIGIQIYKGHKAANIGDCDLVVYTAAIHDDNPELADARRRGIRCIERPVLLGEIMKFYRNAINVCGTHGKTTVTSMISVVLLECGLDPTVLVGGELAQIGGNMRLGGDEYFVCEACEYVDSFLKFFPSTAVVLNIEEDHLDYFKDINQIVDSFHHFLSLLPEDGAAFCCGDDENVSRACEGIKAKIIRYGLDGEFEYSAKDIVFDEKGNGQFILCHNGEPLSRVSLNVPGIHNVKNAVAVLALADHLELEPQAAADALGKFFGTHRRFEFKGSKNGFSVYDDYAHHPSEIRVTLQAAQNKKHNDIWCIFQPHTYTRTRTLFHDFVKVLAMADKLIITDIYAAREKDDGSVSARQLAEQIPGAVYISDFHDIADYVIQHAKEGDLVLTVGAGTIHKAADYILEKE